jgi:hypothetical protein
MENQVKIYDYDLLGGESTNFVHVQYGELELMITGFKVEARLDFEMDWIIIDGQRWEDPQEELIFGIDAKDLVGNHLEVNSDVEINVSLFMAEQIAAKIIEMATNDDYNMYWYLLENLGKEY